VEYIDLLLREGVNESAGFRHVADIRPREAKGRERWVINKLRALCAWYSKGIDCGSHLRIRVNSATSIQELRDIVDEFFLRPDIAGHALAAETDAQSYV